MCGVLPPSDATLHLMSLFLVPLAGGAVTVQAAASLLSWQSTEHSLPPGPVGQCAVIGSLGKVQLRIQSSSVRAYVWNKQAELLGGCPPRLAEMVGAHQSLVSRVLGLGLPVSILCQTGICTRATALSNSMWEHLAVLSDCVVRVPCAKCNNSLSFRRSPLISVFSKSNPMEMQFWTSNYFILILTYFYSSRWLKNTMRKNIEKLVLEMSVRNLWHYYNTTGFFSSCFSPVKFGKDPLI